LAKWVGSEILIFFKYVDLLRVQLTTTTISNPISTRFFKTIENTILPLIMAAVATSSSIQVVDTDPKLRLAGTSDKSGKM